MNAKLVPSCLCAGVVVMACASAAIAQSAARDLPESFRPGETFPISLSITLPPAVTAVGAEDMPPAGWAPSAISHSGSFDSQAGKVKWGPFFSPSIPTTLTYDVDVPAGAGGEHCFSGVVSFDGADQPVGGDTCVAQDIPAVTAWGLLVLGLLVMCAATVVICKARRPRSLYDS